jgi:hypothetical protein
MGKFCKIIFRHMPVILTGMFLFSCQSDKDLSPEQSIRSLKVLNSDLTNMLSTAQQTPGFTGLDFLLQQPSSPFSVLYGIPGRFAKDSLQDIDKWNGRYEWNKDSMAFFLAGPAKEIKIDFPLDKGPENNARFTFTGYECQPSMLLSCFPAAFIALMEYQGNDILNIKYMAEFEDRLPINLKCEIEGDGFAGSITMDRTRDGDNGTMTFHLSFNAKGYTFIEGTVKTEIGYNGSLIYSKVIEPELTIFDTHIEGRLDYGKVNPTSQDYIKSFNENCHIVFREKTSGKKIGDFGLGKDQSGELLEWGVYLSDSSMASLYDYLLFFKKFMDYKYPNNKHVL